MARKPGTVEVTPEEKLKLAKALHGVACAIARVWDVEREIEARAGFEINFPNVGEFTTDTAVGVSDPEEAFNPENDGDVNAFIDDVREDA